MLPWQYYSLLKTFHMKRILLFLFLALVFTQIEAQTFTDDFESYNDGDLIGASSSDWTTWGGSTTDDAPITTEQAHSGTKSLKIQGVGSGGPADIILPFGGSLLTSGSFELEMYVFVKEGADAYFNIQGDTKLGETWSENFFFNTDGSFTGDFTFRGAYTHNEWNKLQVKIDLSHNIWSYFLNDTYIGSYKNAVNKIASMDIFPTSGSSSYYVDDVSYTIVPDAPTLATLNATLNVVEAPAVTLAGSIEVNVVVRNTGTAAINAFDVVFTSGGTSETVNVSETINSLEEKTLTLPKTFAGGENVLKVEVTNINGGTDADMTDNTLSTTVNGIVPPEHRKVMFEEATGTWCPWCPRGAVFMDAMAERFGDLFVGVAVHAGDTMQIEGYGDALGFESYPTMSSERQEIFGFGLIADVEARFWERIQLVPPAAVYSHAVVDDNNTLKVVSQADFLQDATEEYRLAVVLVEDGVTGTTSGFAQSNAYAGGGNGVMGGYENLPNMVPAAQMVYDHVARALVSPFSGAVNSLPAAAINGASYDFVMPEYTIPSHFDLEKLHIVTLILNADGEVVNVNSQTLAEAADFVLGGELVEVDASIAQIYPNPFTGISSIYLSLVQPSDVSAIVYNTVGQVVKQVNYGHLSGKVNVDFDASDLKTGAYMVQIRMNNSVLTKRIIIQE